MFQVPTTAFQKYVEHNVSVIGTLYIKLFSQKLLASHDKLDLRE